jgi:hypothetical protein
MRRVLPVLAAALTAAIAASFAPLQAEASALPLTKPAVSAAIDGSYRAKAYDDDEGYDGGYAKSYGSDDYGYRSYGYKSYRHKDYYEKDDNYKAYGDDDYDDRDYSHKYYGRSCGYPRYVQKYVCDQTVPRCFRQRENIWYYGREYTRYVRKCVGGENYCKWVSVPVYDNCD